MLCVVICFTLFMNKEEFENKTTAVRIIYPLEQGNKHSSSNDNNLKNCAI